ncbi:hypothetical protein NE237_014609 [Protea cynaroides]|uniref:Uncharacterized protein n=1 Tax=Protea cynaroides TaxID=273540 RepID=A0A9Q0KCA6_9MAGN|nr:hypothetical protein NE237_014609 [Protea cynaroides]
MNEMIMSSNIAKLAIPLYSATNAVTLISARRRLLPLHPHLSLLLSLSLSPSPNSCNSITPHLQLVKGKVAAHDPLESDFPARSPPEIPSVPTQAPYFPPELPGLGNTPSELEPVGPEILPDPVPQKPPLEPPGGPEFPVPPIPSPPGPDIPMPPPPPPPDTVPPEPPEIVPPPPNITPPTGPFSVAGRGTTVS